VENGEPDNIPGKKKARPIDREINTALFVLRAIQCGISVSDLELLSIGMVNDIFTEMKNDEYDYPYKATQEDIDRL
jgi:hypothetical protein